MVKRLRIIHNVMFINRFICTFIVLGESHPCVRVSFNYVSHHSFDLVIICSVYRKCLTVIVFPDINECVDNNGGCEQICHNVLGSLQCRCMDGYRLRNDKKSCEGTKHTIVIPFSH